MSLEDLAMLVGRIDGKLDTLLEGTSEERAKLERLEGRVTTIEGWNSRLIALGAAVGTAVTFAMSYLPGVFKTMKGS